jgi:nicotinamide-nucleotide amidase
MFPDELRQQASALLSDLREKQILIATAESCTGGLIAGLLTEVPGSSDVVDRGFVTYSNDAKIEMLGVRAVLIDQNGAVSHDVAVAMAEGALVHSNAALSVAVTGVAGPGGGTAAKPVGLVHIAAARTGFDTLHEECRYGALSRSEIRLRTVASALALARRMAGKVN